MRIAEAGQDYTEFDWFAVDSLGQLARFSTGGAGAMPSSVTTSKEASAPVAAYFRSVADGEVIDRGSSWGIYWYDCLDTSLRPAGYQCKAHPTTRLLIDSIDPAIALIISRTTLHAVRFGGDEVIPVERLEQVA